jgi:magnesium chelatase family protein
MISCPCGWWGFSTHECTCTPATITRYLKRISDPLLDRIDIHVEVPRVAYDKLTDSRLNETSEKVRARVAAAWALRPSAIACKTWATQAGAVFSR